MAFIHNSGTFSTNPLAGTGARYVQLSHPSVTNVLVLEEMSDDGNGYSIPTIIGRLAMSGRTYQGGSISVGAQSYKTEWSDLAFVVTKTQADLLTQLMLAQTPALPVTVLDVMLDSITKLVLIEGPDNYISSYSGLELFLVQFSLKEV